MLTSGRIVFLAAYKLCPRTGNAADLQRAAQTQEEWLHRYDELLIAMDRCLRHFLARQMLN
jgi:hypothetical protein